MNTLGLSCRSCEHSSLLPVLSLGETPLANGLLRADQLDAPEPRFPLDVVLCPECSLLQLTHSVAPEALFREYLYFSSFSDAMVRHARGIAERLVASRDLGPDSLVVELASNDGYLLQHYQAAGVPVLGVDPARNVAEVARARHGIRTVAEFFDQALAVWMAAQGDRADVIHANNVLAHVPDLNGFVAGIATLLKPGGLAVIEAPYAKAMLDEVLFDTIYHEHLCYFTLTALKHLLARHGLTIVDVEQLTIHGGTLRIFASATGSPSPAVTALLAEEAAWGVLDPDFYAAFAARVEGVKSELPALLHDLKAAGHTLAAYGASAKGSTLLNVCGIGRELLDFVVDRSTVKQGLYTPGTHLPIVGPERLLSAMPGYALLLTWNFAEEILAQQAEYRARGGRFIVPIPTPRVL